MFVERRALMGKGLGWIDVHLLASTVAWATRSGRGTNGWPMQLGGLVSSRSRRTPDAGLASSLVARPHSPTPAAACCSTITLARHNDAPSMRGLGPRMRHHGSARTQRPEPQASLLAQVARILG